MSDERIITNAMIREQDQERIAQLEKLLREVLSDCYTMMRDNGYTASLLERIAAALKETT